MSFEIKNSSNCDAYSASLFDCNANDDNHLRCFSLRFSFRLQ
ncbi:unnamed protein product [Schistosoma curassoni]|uniref:Uncharacterized protein n=1 Tax=Schistosoma curassoni TaxID=6186 RepID=A0A183L322_9TREM|nr:unnamed protein product [Schistosoma curassoni]